LEDGAVLVQEEALIAGVGESGVGKVVILLLLVSDLYSALVTFSRFLTINETYSWIDHDDGVLIVSVEIVDDVSHTGEWEPCSMR
jgi:hypothetical protein